MSAWIGAKILQSLPGLVFLGLDATPASSIPGFIYELRMYWTYPGRLDDVLARFRDHTLRLFARYGIKGTAYWKVIEPTANGPTFV